MGSSNTIKIGTSENTDIDPALLFQRMMTVATDSDMNLVIS